MSVKRCIADYFQTRKKISDLGKESVLVKNIKLTKNRLAKDAQTLQALEKCVKDATPLSESAADQGTSSIVTNIVNLKRRISSSSDVNSEHPTKKICNNATRKPNLLLPNVNNNTIGNEIKKSDALSKLKKSIAKATELKESSLKATASLERLDCPSYQKFSHLTHESSTELALPYKYKIILETFHCLETVISMLYNRQEVCSLGKVQPSVRAMMRRQFTLEHLGQIITVNPKAYTLSLERKLTNCFRDKNSEDRQLVINPNLDHGESDLSTKDGFIAMAPKVLVKREAVFRNNLINITKLHHEKFLQSLSPQVTVKQSDILRWHPSFPINDVPDVEPSEVPMPNKPTKIATAKDVLENVRGIYCKQLENALETVAKKSEDSNVVKPNDNNNNNEKPKPVLKGLSSSLLEKIRAREAAKAISVITTSPEVEKRKRMLTRLPEVARILKTLFIGERKASLIASYVIEKIQASIIGSISYHETEELLKLLSRASPDWFSSIVLTDGTHYYKLQREVDLNIILEKIKSFAIKFSVSC